MYQAVSTYVYVSQRLNAALLESLAKAGANGIELFAARQHFDYRSRAHVREIAAWFKSNPTELHSVHSPMYSDLDWGRDGTPPVNIADTDKRRRIDAMDEIKRAIEVAEHAPFRYLVQHIGNSGEDFNEHKRDAVLSSVEHLRAFAKPLGVTLALENIPNELSTAERLLDTINVGHFQDVGVCFDTGHALISGNIPGVLEPLKELVRTTHVHDNQGVEDNHLWPGEGRTDWETTMELLRACPHVPPLLLEINGDNQEGIPIKVEKAFRDLNEAAVRAEKKK